MKRKFLIMLCLILVTSMTLGSIVFNAAGSIALSATNVIGTPGGSPVTVSINVSNPQGFTDGQMKILYNPAFVEPVVPADITAGDLGLSNFAKAVDDATGTIEISYVKASGVNANGKICDIKFTISSNVTVSESIISITPVIQNSAPLPYFTLSNTSIPTVTTHGKITTVNPTTLSSLQKMVLEAMSIPLLDPADPAGTTISNVSTNSVSRMGFVAHVLKPLHTKLLVGDVTQTILDQARKYFDASITNNAIKEALEAYVVYPPLKKTAAEDAVLEGLDSVSLTSVTGFTNISGTINEQVTGSTIDNRGLQFLIKVLRETVVLTDNGVVVGPVAGDNGTKIKLGLQNGVNANVTDKFSNLLSYVPSLMSKVDTTLTSNSIAIAGMTNFDKLMKYCEIVANAQSDAEIAAFKTFLTANSEAGAPIYKADAPAFICGDVDGDNAVTSADYGYIKLYLLNKLPQGFPSASGMTAGDVDGDHAVTSADYGYVKLYLLNKLPQGFPAAN